MTKKDFRDNIGYVELISVHGDEEFISKMSGVSHDNDTGAPIEKLLRWGHLSPLEFASLTFKVKCPIFVARQLLRHRTGHYVEKSLRYCEAKPEAYAPEGLTDSQLDVFEFVYEQSFGMYEMLVASGVPKEQARILLPLGTYTEIYMQFDMRNLKHMLELRTDNHAQSETQWYANAMLEFVDQLFPTIGDSIRGEM